MADELGEMTLERQAELIEMNLLRAKMRGVDQLVKALSECQSENEVLRRTVLTYDDAMVRLQNRLECFASRGEQLSGSPPSASRALVSNLLSDNQTLKARVAELELCRQGGGFSELQERNDTLEAENRALRAELDGCRPILEMLHDDVSRTQSGLEPFALAEQLAHMQRTVKVKTVMCETLTEELDATQKRLASLMGSSPLAAPAADEPDHTKCNRIMKEMKEHVRELQGKLEEQCQATQQALHELEHHKAQAETYMQDIDKLQQEIKRLSHGLKDEAEQHEGTKDLVGQLQSNLVTLNDSYQLTKRETANMRIMHTQKVNELEDELAHMKDERISFLNQIEVYKADFEAERDDRERIMKDNQDLQRRLADGLPQGGGSFPVRRFQWAAPSTRNDLVPREARRNPLAGYQRAVMDSPGEPNQNPSGQQ